VLSGLRDVPCLRPVPDVRGHGRRASIHTSDGACADNFSKKKHLLPHAREAQRDAGTAPFACSRSAMAWNPDQRSQPISGLRDD
jgi:hypothetical protein